MTRAKFLLIGFIFCNLTWQILVWGIHFVHPWLGMILVILLPVLLGVVVYLVFLIKADDDWTMVFLISVIFFPIFYFSLHATRAPEYVEFVHDGYRYYAGGVGEINSADAKFYELTDFALKDAKAGEFGASYGASTRKSSTTHTKNFVVPLFDKNDLSAPRAWLFDSYHSRGSRIDNGDHGYYGFDRTDLSKPHMVSTLYAKKVSSDGADGAIAQYLNKKNLPPARDALVLEIVDEPAESYYRKGKIYLWIWTFLLNLCFMGFSFSTSGKTPKSDRI
jgi:hypothetical protein